MEIAIFSDLHLGLKSDSQEWHKVAYDWIDSMVTVLKKKKIKDIFFLGDWFHNRSTISVATLHATSIILDKLEDFTLWIFPGNHDLYFSNQTDVSAVSLFKGYPNVKYFNDIQQISLGGKEITLCPWGLSPLGPELNNTEYLFGHFEINTFQMNSSEQLCEDGIKLSDLLKKYKNIFSGHFHKAQQRVYSAGMVQYVGNPFQMNFGEAEDDKGFLILNLETGKYNYVYNKISPKFIKLSLSQLIRMDIEAIDPLIKNNFLRLSIDKNITVDDMDELLKLISACKPNDCDIDWDNNGFNSGVDSKTDFVALELLTALTEYTKLLEIENQKEVISYLTKKYKEISDV